MIASYQDFFRLPTLTFELTLWSAVAATVISFAAAALGVLSALRNVIRTAPAVAMRPAAPLRFRQGALESLFSKELLRPHRTMMLRNLAGRPLRTVLSIVGIAFAVPMVVLGLFWHDAIDQMIQIQFNLVDRGNISVTFPQPLDRSIIHDLAREPGVLVVEGERIVPARLRAGYRTYLTSVTGLSTGGDLRRPHDTALRPIDVSPDGITLTRRLAERLAVIVGDVITVEVMEGRQSRRDVPVTAIVDETVGMSSYMEIGALNRLTGEGVVVSAATMFSDPAQLRELSLRLKQLPVIESVSMKAHTVASFLDKIAGLVFVSASILTGFGVLIAVGVVYNSARIRLQERAWELASLRVLGFTRAETARILFGEFVVELALAIPVGLIVSRLMIGLIARWHSNESFQIPAVIEPRTYAAAAAIVVGAAAASALVVRRRIDRLDLVAVLKTRD